MTKNRVLLFGSTGQLGHELTKFASDLGEVTALTRVTADLSDPESLTSVMRRYNPDVVINAAAYTAVDRAEGEPDLAHTVNAVAPGVLAREAEALGACMVHFSSDYVFDGKKDAPYLETDVANPVSAYGRSKLLGDQAVASACSRHLIFRTTWVVGAHGANFLKTILRAATHGDSLRVVADQFGVPTSAAMLADITVKVLAMLRRAGSEDRRWGVYHAVPAGETSWYLYARYGIERGRQLGIPVKATPESVTPISTAEYPTAARRPANSRLGTEKLRSAFSLDLPDWTIGVDLILREISLCPPK